MRFFIPKIKKLPPAVQKGLLPRKEFIAQGRERFLAAFDASALAGNARPARTAYVSLSLKFGIGAMAVLCVAVGMSAYAETANVSPTNPLYPLKRLSENVQLALTPAPQKAQLQAAIAVRRAGEIEGLQISHPTSTLIPKLTNDLDEEISSSLGAAGAPAGGSGQNDRRGRGNRNAGAEATSAAPAVLASTSVSTSTSPSSLPDAGPITVYCGAFNVSTSGVLIGRLERNLALHPEALAQFNEQCGTESHRGENGKNDGASPVRQPGPYQGGSNGNAHMGEGAAGGMTTTIVTTTTSDNEGGLQD